MTMDLSFYRSSLSLQLRAEGREEGREEESVKKLLRVLDKRGVATSDEQRARVEGCTDIDQLDVWFDRALTATIAAEVFDAD